MAVIETPEHNGRFPVFRQIYPWHIHPVADGRLFGEAVDK